MTKTHVFTKIKYGEQEYKAIEKNDLNNNSEIKRFVEHYEEVISHIQVTAETKRILKTLEEINALKYIEPEEAFLKNKLELVIDEPNLRDKILNDINQKTFYVLEANHIANYVFNIPSSNRINLDNASIFLNDNISRILREKINFLKSIEVKRDAELNILEIKKVNGKSIGKDSIICINDLKSTKLKVGRLDNRIIIAAVPGNCIRRKKDIIFNEEDDGTEALVIILTERFTKKYIIDSLDLKYFGFLKECIIGITDFENVKSLF